MNVKVVLPHPHVTLRKKNPFTTIGSSSDNSDGGSLLRRSMSGIDPMADTLQKWKDSMKENDSIREEGDEGE